MLELVSSASDKKNLRLLLWNGHTASIASRIHYGGRTYEPAAIEPTIIRAMTLPAHIASHQSPRHLLNDMASTVQHYTPLSENLAGLVAHFVLATWVLGCIPAAPRLAISGPDSLGGTQLLLLLHCLCRRPLLLTQVDINGLLSLPMEWRPTLLIHQPQLSIRMEQFLNAVQKRCVRVPRRGRLLELHNAAVTYSESRGGRTPCKLFGLEIPVFSAGRDLPALDDVARQKIADDFQPRLLAYRLENYGKVCQSHFDASEFISPTRELAGCLGACTPEDPDLQAQLIQLLKGQDTEYRSALWTDLNTAIIEALVAYIHEGELNSIYVGKIAESAEVILEGRGEHRRIEARHVGERLRNLGLNTEPRDSKGMKLIFSQAVKRRVHELAHDLDVPTIRSGKEGCPDCNSLVAQESRPGDPARMRVMAGPS
jgi:hypothetical protein